MSTCPYCHCVLPEEKNKRAYQKLLEEDCREREKMRSEIERLKGTLKSYCRHCCSECSMYVEKELGPDFRRVYNAALGRKA